MILFLLEGAGGGGSRKIDHEFPFLRDVELVELSLSEQKLTVPAMKPIDHSI